MIEVDIEARRGNFEVNAAFTAEPGLTALFGPSGSGKSTLLNMIAGLARPDRGRIACNNVVFLDTARGIELPGYQRRVGYVFQDALLFPHLTVKQNLLYGRWFSDRKAGPGEFDRIIELLGIRSVLGRRPATLSGGERQRVAIGRALLSGPRLLLMDEPLAALDIARKREILPHIERLRDELNLPILYVSHATDEVARLANSVIVMDAGRVMTKGPPSRALAAHVAPAGDRFEQVSVLTARAPVFDSAYGLTSLQHAAGKISIAGELGSAPGGLRIVIRATDVTLALSPPRAMSIRTALAGRIDAIETGQGPVVMAQIELEGGDRLAAAVTRKSVDELGLDSGDRVWCLIKAVSIDERWISARHASRPR